MVEKLSVQIALEGGAELQSQFAAATSSIAKLGNTAEQAFAGAAAAAQKFSATTAELGQVEGIIKALGARAKDSSVSFSELAANYDRARQSAAAFVPAAAKVEQAIKTTGSTAAETRGAINTLAQALNAIGVGPAGRIATAIGNIGTRFGALALAGSAVGGTAAALIKFATAAEDTEKALTQLQKVSGQSFENLSALQQVFAQGGTEAKKFASDFANLSEKIAEAGQQMARGRAGSDWLKLADDIDVVREKFTNLANGASVVFSPLTTLDTKVKALLQSLSKVPQTEQYSRLADIFKNLGSELERAQIGKKLGLTPEQIATLTQGSAAIRQLQADAERLGLTLTSSDQQALQQMAQTWNRFTSLVGAAFQKIGALAAPALTALVDSFTPVLQQIVSDFETLPLDQAIAKLGQRLAPAFAAIGQLLTPIATTIGTAAGTAFANAVLASIKSSLIPDRSMWDAIFNDFAKFGESIVQNAQILGAKIKQALKGSGADTMGPLQPGSGGFESRAGGGLLGGSGTGTSDSNLAWVSRGEYITPARAVAQPGVLALLEALRRSGGNLSAVLNGMGRFALGGMVPRAMPAFASGGLSGGNNVTIAFPGLPPIGGLRASSAVVDELRRSAALAQVRSGGRKPSRYA